MLVMQESTIPSWVSWGEPMETISGSLAGCNSNNSGLAGVARPDITLSDRLLIASITNLPSFRRPWGIITWLADHYNTTRQTIYNIGNSIRDKVLGLDNKSLPVVLEQENEKIDSTTTNINILERTILTLAFPGGVSIRPMQQILQMSLGTSRSIGFISQFLLDAGKQAGRLLSSLDYGHLDAIIALRDETFFNNWPILLLVEPRSGMIFFGHVAADRTAETWGTALLLTEDQNLSIKGRARDMAKAFPPSLKLIGSKAESKKDNWHLQRDAGKVRQAIERKFYQILAQMVKVEKKLTKKWSDKQFNKYCELDEQLEYLMNQHDSFEPLVVDLAESLLTVEAQTGEIRQFELAAWYLEETIKQMEKLTHEKIVKLVKSLKEAQAELLTNLKWLAPLVVAWQEKASQHWGSILTEQAQKLIARTWKLRQLVINGYTGWKKILLDTEETLSLLYEDEIGKQLCQLLMENLDSVPRASSMIENINGLLKRFLSARRAFRNRQTAQLYLNLFILWYNSHVFQRGKRKGKSPFEWAKMNLPSHDWLTLLGFPKNV